MYRCSCWWMPKSQRRYAGADAVKVLPLHSQNVVLRFSPFDKTVHSLMSKHDVRASRRRRPPVSSRSKLMMLPWGFEAVSRLSLIELGQMCHHTTSQGVETIAGGQGRTGEPNTASPCPQGILVTCCNRWERGYLCNVCGPGGHVGVHPLKVTKGMCTPLCGAMRPLDVMTSRSAWCQRCVTNPGGPEP